MSDIEKLMRQIQARQQIVPQLKGLGLSFEIAQAFAAPRVLDNPVNALIGDWSSRIAAMAATPNFQQKLLAQQTAITGIASSLGPWMAMSSNAGALSSSVLNGHLGLFGGLTALQDLFQNQQRNPFQTLSTSLQDVISQYTQHLSDQTTDEEVEEFADVINAMGSIATTYAQADRQMTDEDVAAFGEEMTGALAVTLPQTSSDDLRKLIVDAAAIIGLFVAVIGTVVAIKTDRHVDRMDERLIAFSEAQGKFVVSVEQRLTKIEGALEHGAPIRLFRTTCEVHLRQSATSTSLSLRILPEGQEVVTIWPSNGWLYVCIGDSATGEVLSGYISEKHLAAIQ